ncbi:MAG: hypothetical protein H6696_21435 [Deferribacteres bacterium]|nr:hypothetical protein [Deferribacteres bacterium]
MIIQILILVLQYVFPLLAGFLIWKKFQAKRKHLKISTEYIPHLIDIHNDIKGKDEVKISYNDKIIENLNLIRLRIMNDGNTEIRRDDFERNLVIQFPNQTNILKISLFNASDKHLNPKFNFTNNEVTIYPLLLNKNEFVLFQIIGEHLTENCDIDCRIAGTEWSKEDYSKKMKTPILSLSSEPRKKSLLDATEGVGKMLIWLGLFGIGFMSYDMGKKDVIPQILKTIRDSYIQTHESVETKIYSIKLDVSKPISESEQILRFVEQKDLKYSLQRHSGAYTLTIDSLINYELVDSLKSVFMKEGFNDIDIQTHHIIKK